MAHPEFDRILKKTIGDTALRNIQEKLDNLRLKVRWDLFLNFNHFSDFFVILNFLNEIVTNGAVDLKLLWT